MGLRLQLTFPLLSSRGHETPLTPQFYKPYTKLRFLFLIQWAHARPEALWLASVVSHGENIYFLSVPGPTVPFLTAAYRSVLYTAPELFGQFPFDRFPATASVSSINAPCVSRASGEDMRQIKPGARPLGRPGRGSRCAGLSLLPANLLSVSPEAPTGNYLAKGKFFQLTF